MVIRLAKMEDKEDIDKYCAKNGFFFPTSQTLFTVTSDGKLRGIAGLEIIVKVEPFIADSPIIAKRLYDYLMAVLQRQNLRRVECFTTDEKLDKVKPLFKKLGFNFIERTNRFIKEL